MLVGACAALQLPVASPARAATCATTTAPGPAGEALPGDPCWVDVTPYPFGSDGLPVDPSSRGCSRYEAPTGLPGYEPLCYLRVTSMAFRAWNRGVASLVDSTRDTPTTAFGVWLYNGSRWYPDPAFPGRRVCRGDTVLWAGKLDYWLVGGTGSLGSPICRYDGSTFGWEALDFPAETRAKLTAGTLPSVSAGACFAWNDCWFFGPEGLRVHWDGGRLTDHGATIEDFWLRSRITAAAVEAGVDGQQTAVAAAWTSGDPNGGTLLEQQVPAYPDGTAPAQLLASTGGAFAPLPFAPPTTPRPGDPWRTDLVAVDLDARGRGWVAGNPVGYGPRSQGSRPGASSRATTDPQPAPLASFALGGSAACTAPDPGFEFEWSASMRPNGRAAYLWSSLSVFPDGGTALAGGTLRPPAAGAARNDDGTPEPALTTVGCDGSATTTRFRVPDPTPGDPGIVPANYSGAVDAVAANAANDAWAAASTSLSGVGGILIPQPGGQPLPYFQRPHLYHFTDTARPSAPAGDDDEQRPAELVEDAPIFIDEEPEPEPTPIPEPAPTPTPTPAPTKRVRQLPAVYGAHPSKPKLIRGNRYRMVVRFRVRRTVTIGIQALRRNRVVARSGLKRFRRGRATLTLEINRKRWPTRVRFYTRSGSAR